MIRRGVIRRGVIWRGVIWHGLVWHGLVWHGVIWHSVIWRRIGARNKTFVDGVHTRMRIAHMDASAARRRDSLHRLWERPDSTSQTIDGGDVFAVCAQGAVLGERMGASSHLAGTSRPFPVSGVKCIRIVRPGSPH